MMTFRLLCLGAMLGLSVTASAQVVRGTIREAATGAPMPGVIVSLRRVVDSARGLVDREQAVLTEADGTFSIQGAGAGTYVVTAKRIGFGRRDSPLLTLAAGGAVRWDISLSPIDVALALPTIRVEADAPCSIRPADGQRVALLWDDARAALVATQLSLRDRLFRASIVRYVRRLAPPTMRVLRQEEHVQHGVTERAFRSLAPDSLSDLGYVRSDPDGSLVFFAPDAEVLTSTSFLRDHCFSLAPPARDHGGMVGLSFAPVARVRTPDVRGTIWMDSSTHELRQVEFRYTQVRELNAARADAYGEVRFGRLANGAWHVSRWFIRLPSFRPASPRPGQITPSGVDVAFYTEEGGHVTPAGTGNRVRSAVIAGRLMDSSASRGLRDATIRLAGTTHQVRSMGDGTFRLDSLTAGRYTIQAETPEYSLLGMLAAEQELEVEEGQRVTTVLSALRTEQVLRRLCGTEVFGEDRAALRVVVRDSANGPLPGVLVRSRYDTFDVPNTPNISIVTRPRLTESLTDTAGALTLCDLPARQRIRVELDPEARRAVRDSITLRPGSIGTLVLRP